MNDFNIATSLTYFEEQEALEKEQDEKEITIDFGDF